VDRKSNEKKYPKELLLRWKRDREGDLAVQLNGLPGLDDDKLQDMMAAVVIETKNDIAVAIDELATISSDTADTLRALVAETFDRPYLEGYQKVPILFNLPRRASHRNNDPSRRMW